MKVIAQRVWKASPLEVIEIPDLQPKPSEVRVKVAAIGVNPVDWKMREGGPLKLATRLIGPPLPFVPGVDFAGTVDQVGRKVTTLKVGDRVVGGVDFSRGQRGSYAEQVTARPDQMAVLPPGVSFEIAGSLPVAGVTPWMSLMEIGRLASRGADRKVLILGAAGGVGQFAVQIAKMANAVVIGVCSAKNFDRVRALGADDVIDYNEGDPLATAKAAGPYDIVIDTVGQYAGGTCRGMLKRGGRHVIVSGESPSKFLQVLIPPFTTKMVLGVSTTPRLTALVDAVAAGTIKVEIAARFPLTEAEAAHTMSKAGKTAGKIVLLTS